MVRWKEGWMSGAQDPSGSGITLCDSIVVNACHKHLSKPMEHTTENESKYKLWMHQYCLINYNECATLRLDVSHWGHCVRGGRRGDQSTLWIHCPFRSTFLQTKTVLKTWGLFIRSVIAYIFPWINKFNNHTPADTGLYTPEFFVTEYKILKNILFFILYLYIYTQIKHDCKLSCSRKSKGLIFTMWIPKERAQFFKIPSSPFKIITIL